MNDLQSTQLQSTTFRFSDLDSYRKVLKFAGQQASSNRLHLSITIDDPLYVDMCIQYMNQNQIDYVDVNLIYSVEK